MQYSFCFIENILGERLKGWFSLAFSRLEMPAGERMTHAQFLAQFSLKALENLREDIWNLWSDDFLFILLGEAEPGEPDGIRALRAWIEAGNPVDGRNARAVFPFLLDCYRTYLRQEEEKKALEALFPQGYKEKMREALWDLGHIHADTPQMAVWAAHTQWGRLEIVLHRARWDVLPTAGRSYPVLKALLSREEEGSSLRLLLGNGTDLPMETAVYFEEAAYRVVPGDYALAALLSEDAYDSPWARLQQVAWALVYKEDSLGAEGLNPRERALFPLAQALVGQTAEAGKICLWADRLKTEAGDKALYKALQAEEGQNPYSQARRQRKYAAIWLSTPEGARTFHWVFREFWQATGAYPPMQISHSVAPEEAEAARQVVTVRLAIEGYTGAYPLFRKKEQDGRLKTLGLMEADKGDHMAFYLQGVLARPDKKGEVFGVPWQEATPYLGLGSLKRSFWSARLCGAENPLYEAGPSVVECEAKARMEEHLRQVLLVLDGKRMERAYKAAWGIVPRKNTSYKRITVLFLAMGAFFGFGIWLLFGVFTSLLGWQPLAEIVNDPFYIKMCILAGGMFFLFLEVFLILASWNSRDRR